MDESLKNELIALMRRRITSGEDWHRAILSAASQWPLDEEEVDGERFVYLIDGEALDLARLYDRLCLEIADLVPESEIEALVVSGQSSSGLSRDDMKTLLGPERYKAYLTFIYGVMVEELVVLAFLEDLRRRRRTSGLTRYDADLNEAYIHVYGESRPDLLARFRKENGRTRKRRVDMAELQEFTYWLFKLRLKNSDKSRVASDTKRALVLLEGYMAARGLRAL